MAADVPVSGGDDRAGVDLWALADLCTPWCLHVAVTLRIAERLSEGSASAEELARGAGCDAHALAGVLGHLCGRGVFVRPAPGRFALNDAARGLLDPGIRLGLDLTGIGGRMAGAWSTLPAFVRTGTPAYAAVFGVPFWDDLAAHSEVGESFDALMGPAGHGSPDPQFPLAAGWDDVETVVDVGGGTGAMLAAILRARPGLRGILVDLPGTVARAGPLLEAAGVAERVTRAGQSFFDPLPAGGDVYLLRKVINDWPDAEAAAILRRCAEAAGRDGRVVVLGSDADDDRPAALAVEAILVGGRSRTVGELIRLAGEAGLEHAGTGRQESGYVAVEFRPH